MSAPRLICFVDALDSEYVSRALLGIRESLDRAGWELVTKEGGALLWDDRIAMLHDEAHRGENSAAAFVHFHLTSDQASLFKSAKLPIGYLGGTLAGVESVLDDGNEGAFLGASHLIGLGHRRIALLVGDFQIFEARTREAGFQRAMRGASLAADPDLTVQVKPAVAKEGFKAAGRLLANAQRPSAIFCAAGDLVAAGVYEAAAKLGLKIPRDLSVLGYDDLPQSAKMNPPLTTLRQPLEAMGNLLASQLIKAASAGPSHKPTEKVVKPGLELRQSCAEPRKS